MKNQIQIKNLFFRYRERDQWILEDVGMDFETGDFVILSGPNGGGKTTLISLLLGFSAPNRGDISIPENKDLFSYLPQRGTYDTVPMRVLDVLTSCFVNSRTFFSIQYKKEREQAQKILDSFDLGHLAGERFENLSGGQIQKILLCRVFLKPAPFIILDEPFSNMDRASKTIFLQALKTLQKTSAILLISHDMDLIAEHKGAFWYLNNGFLARYGNIDEMDHAFFHTPLK